MATVITNPHVNLTTERQRRLIPVMLRMPAQVEWNVGPHRKLVHADRTVH